MKSTGIVRRLDDLGRVVLPIELRRNLNLAEKDSLEIYTDGDSIVLRKYTRGCKGCGDQNKLVTVRGMTLCTKCIEAFVANV